MIKIYRRKVVVGLLTLQFLFLIIFSFAFINLLHNRPIIDVGLSSVVVNSLVIVCSIISMFNVLFELSRVN